MIHFPATNFHKLPDNWLELYGRVEDPDTARVELTAQDHDLRRKYVCFLLRVRPKRFTWNMVRQVPTHAGSSGTGEAPS